MEVLYSRLKKMDVVSLSDGKNLGKVCDLSFCFPENRIKGLFVTGGKGFRLTKSDMFIPVSCIAKIGEDVVLADLGKRPCAPDPCRHGRDKKCPPPPPDRRSYDEYE